MSGPDLSPGSSQKTTPSADAVMKGRGFYNEHSRPQHKAERPSVEMQRKFAARGIGHNDPKTQTSVISSSAPC
jgi:hypothetical protein